MNNFEMPVMELVSFSAEDIIRTSDGGDQSANSFDIGNDYKKAGTVTLMGGENVTTIWNGAEIEMGS